MPSTDLRTLSHEITFVTEVNIFCINDYHSFIISVEARKNWLLVETKTLKLIFNCLISVQLWRKVTVSKYLVGKVSEGAIQKCFLEQLFRKYV